MKYIEQTPLARDQERKDRWAIGVTWYISGSCRRQFLEGVEHKLMPFLTALHEDSHLLVNI